MQNTTADKYIEICSLTADVQLESEFAPFLRPSQFVDYTQDSACVALAANLAAEASGEAGAVANIYAYIRDHIAYDRDKAATVQSGYLPDPDATLAAAKASALTMPRWPRPCCAARASPPSSSPAMSRRGSSTTPGT